MNKHNGFTLIELLLVVQIVLLSTYFVLPKQNTQVIQHEVVLHQIKLMIEKTRLEAMNTHSHQTIEFNDSYIYLENVESFYYEQLHFQNKSMTFNAQGHIQQASTIYFQIANQSYKLIINLGQGVYRIEKI